MNESNKLIVQSNKPVYSLIVLLSLFFIPLGVWNLINFLFYDRRTVSLIVGLMLLLCFGAVTWLVFRGYRKSVDFFAAEGLTRNDGKQFLWTNLARVVAKVRYKHNVERKKMWRLEIQFKDGSAAWLLPLKVKNWREVMNYVNALPCERTEEEA